ncbi:MAG TPA: HEPN domain-containing protein [Anaerolineales bacterium]|nr:HEPN domain-containing protein [Anaerolineales bacterium]
MNEHIRNLLDRSLDAIEAAEGLMNMGKMEIAAGRAYYAMFYVAEALLEAKGLGFSQHGQVISAYGQHFAKTKELDPKFHRWLVDAFDIRITGDYNVDETINQRIVASLINQAREFLGAAQEYLDKQHS